MKKAIIDKILLLFILLAMIIVFLGSVADERKAMNKYNTLKKIAQTTALSAVKYYVNVNDDTDEAEDIAKEITKNISLIRNNIDIEDINFTWAIDSLETKSLTVKLPDYKHNFFWFRLLNWNSVDFKNILAKVTFEVKAIEEASDFVPIAVNGCNQEQELKVGETYDFFYKSFKHFNENDKVAFYGLSHSPHLDPQASFDNFKDAVKTVVADKDINMMNIKDMMKGIKINKTIEKDVENISQSFDIENFTDQDMTIAVLDCNSTASNPIIKELIPIHMNEIFCVKACCKMSFMGGKFSFGGCSWMMQMMCSILDMVTKISKEVFNGNNFWKTEHSNNCNQANFFPSTKPSHRNFTSSCHSRIMFNVPRRQPSIKFQRLVKLIRRLVLMVRVII